MKELNSLYVRTLHMGLILLQQAVHSGDIERAKREVEFLHNIPSLIDETNIERHRYFWFKELAHYVDQINSSGRSDLQSQMRILYKPIWCEMEVVLKDLFGFQITDDS